MAQQDKGPSKRPANRKPTNKSSKGRVMSERDWMVDSKSKKKRVVSDDPPDPAATVLLCTVAGSKPRFLAADQSFAIWAAVWESEGEELRTTIKGPLARVAAGEMLRCQGRWKKHPQHGWSFDVSQYESALPTNASGIAAWLQTRVDGVGPTFAEAIVEHFGADKVFDILDDDPSKLGQVRTKKGTALPEKQVQKAIDAWDDAKAIRQIEAFLYSHGVSAKLADRLYRHYGEEVIDIMQNHPYRITELRGIGFRIADRVALSLGIPRDDPERIQAGLLFVLEEAEGEGHVFLGLEQLRGAASEALEISSQEKLITAASELAREGKIVAESDELLQQRIYSARLHKIETRLARKVRTMLSAPPKELYGEPTRPLAPEGASAEEIEEMRLPTDEQWQIMELVREKRLAILSGNPGVGKCVAADTRVLVNGENRAIEEVWKEQAGEAEWDGEGYRTLSREKLLVRSINEKSGSFEERPVLYLYRQKVEEMGRRVLLRSGKRISMTQRHRLLTRRGWRADIEAGEMVATEEKGSVSWEEVSEVSSVPLKGWVYDFEVAEHHNYLAEGIVTHNTQTVNEIVRLADEHRLRLKLCAPTGKAARRMSELTAHPAETIHRLLEFSPFEGGFQRHEQNPLTADLVVVDEASMLSLDLADSLFRAIPDHAHLLLVGDPDQLPPVGVGKVLDDLIQSEAVPRVHLTKIFRQAARSMIIQNSRRINTGKLPYLKQEEAERSIGMKMVNDFYWVTRKTPEDTLDLTLDMASERIPRTFGLDPRKDIMVLAPMRKGKVGLDLLNEKLEERLNSDSSGKPKPLVVPKHGIRLGSRIVQTKNSYDEHHYVMNGEIALVEDWNEEKGEALLSLDDGQKTMWVPAQDMETYRLAWALSIHRSQGSQWPCVVVPSSSSHYIMLTRSLVYTAATRASKLCVMTGEKRALKMAVDKIDSRRRNSTLAPRITDPSLSGELF